ncbi:cell division protein FtsL [Bacillus tianshenii]|nr:cell division protein FtsL [Bacillus tianshenii]
MSQVARHIHKRQQEQQQTQTKQVRQTKLKHRVTPGEKIIYLLFSTVFAVMCIIVVSNHASIYQIQSEMQQIESDIDNQKQVNHNLEEKVSELSKPERILRKASENGLKIQKNNVQMIP